MSCLHIINRVISSEQSKVIFTAMSPDDAIVLIEDGCYLPMRDFFASPKFKTFILKADTFVRGVDLPESLSVLSDYTDFVDLTATYDKSLTWTF